MAILIKRGVTGPMPGVLNAPTITHMLQQTVGACVETRDLVTGFIDELPASLALAAHRDDHGAAGPASTTQAGVGMARRIPVMSWL